MAALKRRCTFSQRCMERLGGMRDNHYVWYFFLCVKIGDGRARKGMWWRWRIFILSNAHWWHGRARRGHVELLTNLAKKTFIWLQQPCQNCFIVSELQIQFFLLPQNWGQRLALCITSRLPHINKDVPARIQLITLLPSPNRLERLYHSSPLDNSISRTAFMGSSGTPLLPFPSTLTLTVGLAFQIASGFRAGGWIMYARGSHFVGQTFK